MPHSNIQETLFFTLPSPSVPKLLIYTLSATELHGGPVMVSKKKTHFQLFHDFLLIAICGAGEDLLELCPCDWGLFTISPYNNV